MFFHNSRGAPNPFEQRVTEVIAGNFGVMAAMMVARTQLGDKKIVEFLDKVPEKGEELWVRFRAVQMEKDPEEKFFTFSHFIVSVLWPDLKSMLK